MEAIERLTNEVTRLADGIEKATRQNTPLLSDEERWCANLMTSLAKYTRFLEAKQALKQAHKEAQAVLAEHDEHAGDYVRPMPPDIRKELTELNQRVAEVARKFKLAQIELIHAQCEQFLTGDPKAQEAQLEATYAKIWRDYIDQFTKERLK